MLARLTFFKGFSNLHLLKINNHLYFQLISLTWGCDLICLNSSKPATVELGHLLSFVLSSSFY